MDKDYITVETDRYYQLVENEEYYKKTYSMIRDLIPTKEEIEDVNKWNIEDIQGLFEEVDYALRCLYEVCK
jgi:hypothetical protein